MFNFQLDSSDLLEDGNVTTLCRLRTPQQDRTNQPRLALEFLEGCRYRATESIDVAVGTRDRHEMVGG